MSWLSCVLVLLFLCVRVGIVISLCACYMCGNRCGAKSRTIVKFMRERTNGTQPTLTSYGEYMLH